jgi:putative FmdB family regulatory protein
MIGLRDPQEGLIAMAIYEYSCDGCGSRFEKLVRRSEEVLESGCPSCGDKHLTQEYSTFAARAANSSSAPGSDGACMSSADMPSCGGGMCGMPGMCGRN